MRRSREEIALGILRSCSLGGVPVGKLMRLENLSHNLLMKYLSRLSLSRLVEDKEVGRRKFIWTTPEGVEALRICENAIAVLNGRNPIQNLAPDMNRKIGNR